MKETFGEYIRQKRRKKDVTLIIAAAELGISTSQLHYIERGKANEIVRPKMDILKKLAAYYGLPEDEVVIKGGRIPTDIYFKIVNNLELLNVIKNYEVK